MEQSTTTSKTKSGKISQERPNKISHAPFHWWKLLGVKLTLFREFFGLLDKKMQRKRGNNFDVWPVVFLPGG